MISILAVTYLSVDHLQCEIQQLSVANEQLRCDVETLHKSSTAEEQSYLASVHHLQEQMQKLQAIVDPIPTLNSSVTIVPKSEMRSKKQGLEFVNSNHVLKRVN